VLHYIVEDIINKIKVSWQTIGVPSRQRTQLPVPELLRNSDLQLFRSMEHAPGHLEAPELPN
jgi:hypothetical protein